MRATEQFGRLYRAALKERRQGEFWSTIKRNFNEGTVKPSDFSIREAFENFVLDDHGEPCGRNLINDWGFATTKSEMRSDSANLHKLQEAGAVMTGAFSNITGQIVYNEVMDAWNNPAFIADQLGRTVSTSFLNGERLPGIGVIANENETIGEGQPYPLAGMNEQFVDTPAPDKRGSIIPLTREVIIADRTGVLLERANSITTSLRVSKERRVVSNFIGATTTWSRNGSVATATYGAAGAAPHDFANEHAVALSDYEDVDVALQLFSDMNDPDTGEPISVMPTIMAVPPALNFTAQRILSATEVRHDSDQAEPNNISTIFANPLNGTNLRLIVSPWLARLGTDTDWYVGDPMKAFRYMEVWPISTVNAPTNSELEFTNDIVQRIKVSEYGVPAVVEPRYMVQGDVA